MYKILLCLSIFLFLQTNVGAQIVNIPDANFKAALLGHGTSITGPGISTIDTNGDGEIQVAEAQNYSGGLKLNNQLITTLIGLEAFIAINDLNCSYNQLDSLDISSNLMLRTLNCSNNNLDTLNVLNHVDLVLIDCRNNILNNLDVSNNILLTQLNCNNNPLGALDVSNNLDLTFFNCSNNQLSSIDISNNLDLYDFSCDENQLTTLDLSNNIDLYAVSCGYNQLSYLNVSNLAINFFACENNLPSLQICVPNILVAQSSFFWMKDYEATYVEDCKNLTVEGTLILDANLNCATDSLEQGIANRLLLFDNGVNRIHVLTNYNGEYRAYLDTGTYTVTVLNGNSYLNICPSSQQVTIDTSYQMQTVNFYVQEAIICPYLEVDISTPLLRRCFNSTYYVEYCNTGIATANSAYIEVELDANLSFNSSSIPFVSQTGNVYRFNVGNLPRDTCSRFAIDVTVSCNSLLGEIHCIEAQIYPDSLCLPSLPNIHIADTCLTDTVLFVVMNYAGGVTLPYLLLEDTVVVDTGSFTLNMGQSVSLYHPTNISGTATYQLVLANGSSTHYTASGLVGCDANSVGMDLLHLPNLPQDFADIDCTPNRGSYDPNDKTGYPLGYGSNHYINPNSTIDYRIRFQNTGTDTAIFINIFDTISSNLDVGTLNMGLASHPYTLHIMPNTASGEQVLRFQFSPIHLPDSNVNEPASNGFIEYSIAQVANLPNGTIINNSASIYFDYNAPVKTNTTLHTVCDNCHPENITNSGTVVLDLDKITALDYKVVAIPNPFREQTRIVLEGYTGLSTDLKLEVYDVMGRLQRTLNGNKEGQFLLQRGGMPVGIYFFRISEHGHLLQSGRLSVGE